VWLDKTIAEDMTENVTDKEEKENEEEEHFSNSP
jgi:hypothetical protein